MKIDVTLELKDTPGSLIRAMEPISLHGGNIVSVLHSREGCEPVSVKIGFTTRDQETLDLIKKDLKKQSVNVSEILVEGRRYYSKKTMSLLLIGHVIDKDIRDTIDRINSVGLVLKVDVHMPAPEDKSSVMLEIEADNVDSEKLNQTIADICEEKGFMLIKSL